MCIVWKGMCKQFYEQLVIINIRFVFNSKKKKNNNYYYNGGLGAGGKI